ncbi:MAG: YbaB/EbfC family nucleoid-associated protein [Clostridiales bacterium]|nr:YbaB/EbfC family nucleoid-associated protein [Clostridiales bacterium]
MKARIPKQAGGNMMEQLQRMQQDMQDKTAELEERTYEVKAGGGLVRVVMTGKKQLRELELDPDIVDPEDLETLQDLVIAAVNEAVSTVEETAAREMEKITGALGLPGMPGLMGM